jgi:hypothetical protein
MYIIYTINNEEEWFPVDCEEEEADYNEEEGPGEEDSCSGDEMFTELAEDTYDDSSISDHEAAQIYSDLICSCASSSEGPGRGYVCLSNLPLEGVLSMIKSFRKESTSQQMKRIYAAGIYHAEASKGVLEGIRTRQFASYKLWGQVTCPTVLEGIMNYSHNTTSYILDDLRTHGCGLAITKFVGGKFKTGKNQEIILNYLVRLAEVQGMPSPSGRHFSWKRGHNQHSSKHAPKIVKKNFASWYNQEESF